MEDLQVLADRVRKLDAGGRPLAVQKLDPHPTPERFAHRIVVAISDGSHRWKQARVDRSLREGSGCELRRLVAADDGLSIRWSGILDGHTESARDERSRQMTVDLPAHDETE